MTESAQQKFSGTAPVAEADHIDEAALGRWMAAHVEGFAGPMTLAKFKGGQSNPTYRIDTPGRAYVLRRKPFGPLLPSAHAVDREYRVIAALHPTGFPVARPYGLCMDEGVIGAVFYVMECVDGVTHWEGTLPGRSPDERRAVYESLIDTLAALHQTDHSAIGLGDYGKPGNYFERQVTRWTSQYRASETERIEEVEALIEWLPRTLPVQERTAIVHGDYRIDNVMFDPGGTRAVAVLDWELSTLGDPMADLAYLMMNWQTATEGRAGLLGADLDALGIPPMEAMVARYCAATGRDGVPDLNWYFAFNLFRLTGIVQGIKKRVIDGTASSAHARDMAANVPLLAAGAWGFARKAGA